MKRIVVILSLLFAVILSSCSKDKQDAHYGDLVAVTSSAAYGPKDYSAAVSDWAEIKCLFSSDAMRNALAKAADAITATKRYHLDTVFANREGIPLLFYRRSWQIETYAFTYRSVSAKGEPITLSARLTFPNGANGQGNTVSTLSLVAHYMALKDEMPSLSLSPYSLRVFFNSAVIEPDYQGYGVSEGSCYPGFSSLTLGRQSIDCIMAALEIMADRGVRLADDGYTTAWGYSASSPVVVGMARCYDEQLTPRQQSRIKLRSVFAGGGPMLLDRMVRHIDLYEDYSASAMSYFVPFFSALPSSMLGGYTLDQLVPQWMHEYKVTVDGEEMTFFEAKMRDVSLNAPVPDGHNLMLLCDQLASDMLLPDGHLDYSSHKMQAMMNLLRVLSDWGDWMPSADIYLTHCASDHYIPYDQDFAFYQSKKASGTMHWKRADNSVLESILGSDHLSAGGDATLLTILCRDPETAFNRTPGETID